MPLISRSVRGVTTVIRITGASRASRASVVGRNDGGFMRLLLVGKGEGENRNGRRHPPPEYRPEPAAGREKTGSELLGASVAVRSALTPRRCEPLRWRAPQVRPCASTLGSPRSPCGTRAPVPRR